MVNKDLYDFLGEWLEWATEGGKEHSLFRPEVGLCSNALEWDCHHKRDSSYSLQVAFSQDFLEEHVTYPFGQIDYDIESAHSTHHENANRLSWVRGRMSEYEQLFGEENE